MITYANYGEDDSGRYDHSYIYRESRFLQTMSVDLT